MTYSVAWQSLDGDGQRGFLSTFDQREPAREYAREYARAVAASYRDAGSVAEFDSPDWVLIAQCKDGHRERVTVIDHG